MNIVATNPRLERLIACCAAVAGVSELLFVVLLSGLSMASSVAVGSGMELLGFAQSERPELLRYGVLGFLLVAVFLAPLLETLLLQQVPIVLARRFGFPRIVQFAAGVIPFAATHFSSGVVTGVAAGVVGGVLFSLAYLTFMSQSKTKAFCVTAAVHSLHNLVFGLLYVRDLP